MLKPTLHKLERFLARADHSDETMLLSELDGYLAGVVVCPELMMPSEWLDGIWGGEGPIFASEGEAQEILDAVMAHYNDVIRHLGRPGKYAPILEKDTDGGILWAMWASGFARATALRPEAWADFSFSEDQEVRRAMALFRKLGELADLPGDQFTETDNILDEAAHALIPEHLETLHAARLAMHGVATLSGAPQKTVGRNDPCPCGSGKKFKKCCLN